MRTSAQGKWKAAFVISFSRKNFKEKAGKLALFRLPQQKDWTRRGWK